MSAQVPSDHSLEALSGLAHRIAAGLDHVLQSERPKPDLKLVGSPIEDDDLPRLATLCRGYLRARRHRERLFADALFADPAWDILLDLFACEGEGRRVSVSDACLASHVPPTTGLRWIARLEQSELVRRRPDAQDGRRIYIELKPIARNALAQWIRSHLDRLGGPG